MSLLIPGPKAPDKDSDVYLRPLIDELKEMWADGVETKDVNIEFFFDCMHMSCGPLMTFMRMGVCLDGAQKGKA